MKLLIFLVILPLISYARWAELTEYDFALSDFETVYDIKKDGTYEVSFFKEFEILTTEGVKTFSSYQENFNPHTTKLTFQEAWVENDGGKVPLLSSAILESTPPSKNDFDPQTTWLIKLSDIKVGSKFGIRYKLTVSKPLVDGHFSYAYYFGLNGVWIKKGSLIFKSQMPLEIAAEDPTKSLTIQSFKKKQDELKITIAKPIMQKTIQERGVIPKSLLCAVFVSSSKNWDLIRRQFQSRFDLNFNGPVIPEVEAIIEQVKKRNELEDRVSILLSLLNAKLKHVDDWRFINGQFSLRSFKDIFKSGYADDKEFAALASMILKKLGHSAEIALLEKSPAVLNSVRSMPLPVAANFNHAIVRVETQADTFWVDPSLTVNFGMNLPEDVLGKIVLMLNQNSEVDKIPPRNTLPAVMSVVNDYVKEGATVNSQSKLNLTGVFAHNLFQRFVPGFSKKDLEKRVLGFMSGKVGVESAEFGPYVMTINEFHNLKFSAHLKGMEIFQKDEKGTSFYWPDFNFPYQPFTTHYDDRVGSLYLGEPQEYRIELNFKDMIPINRDVLKACEVNSRWFNYSRRLRVIGGGFSVLQSFELKVDEIPVHELKSQEFKLKGQDLNRCLARPQIYFSAAAVTK